MYRSFALALGVVAFAGAAQAHATLEQSEAAAGSTTKITLRVPHGCDGEATHTVRIQLPEDFYNAKPMPKAGWQLDVVVGPYAKPFESHGSTATEGAREVIWSKGNLEDAWYDEFTLRGTVGPDVAPGTVLYFPATQLCANGTAEWTDTSGNEDAENPAPSLLVVAAEEDHDHDHHRHGAMQAEAAPIQLGPLTITGPFARATLPNAPVAGGFLTVTNTGTEDDRLIAASSDVAGHMEIHEMTMDGDVMKMRELAGGLPIPAGQTVELKPGGFHIMFMDLKQPLVEGETVNVTLTFEKAGEVQVPLAVGPKGESHDHGTSHDSMGKTP